MSEGKHDEAPPLVAAPLQMAAAVLGASRMRSLLLVEWAIQSRGDVTDEGDTSAAAPVPRLDSPAPTSARLITMCQTAPVGKND